jgi:hypothetical protein
LFEFQVERSAFIPVITRRRIFISEALDGMLQLA